MENGDTILTKETEHFEQVQIHSWIIKNGLKSIFFAVPNGGHRAKAVAASLKAEGVSAGVPDMVITRAAGGYHGAYLELKTSKGRLSPEQKQWLTSLRNEGYCAVACRGHKDAIAFIRAYFSGHVTLNENNLLFRVDI